MYQLIVIGNGFDLSCDLKSSFSDFHDYRTKSDLVAHPENTTPPARAGTARAR